MIDFPKFTDVRKLLKTLTSIQYVLYEENSKAINL